MGILDLPAPLFAWVDRALGLLVPPLPRLVLWALAAAAASMLLYRLLSPQRRIAELEAAMQRQRRALAAHDGDFEEGLRMSRQMLGLALARLRLVALPALAAALPVLFIVAWLSTSYGHTLPGPGVAVGARAEPASFRVTWVSGDTLPTQRLAAADAEGRVVQEVPLTAAVTALHKRLWWNVLLGNPAGYLPKEGPLERIELDLPRLEYLPFGPPWLRGWEALFVIVMLAGSLALKFALRIR